MSKNQDFSIFEKIPLQEIISNDVLYSDPDTEKSDKEDEQYLSDEEYKNKYTFLDSFKKPKVKKKVKKTLTKPPPLIKEEAYNSD